MRRASIIWLIATGSAASAFADEPGAARTESSTVAAGSNDSARVRAGDAWLEYDAAVDSLAAGMRDDAIDRFKALGKRYPGHPAATRAIELLARMSAPAFLVPAEPPLTLSTPEEPSGLARAELISFQTAAGILTGAELCVLAECDDTRAVIALLLLGGAAGVGISTLATTDGITAGHATAIDSGTLWGAWNGLAGAVVLDVDDEQQAVGVVLASQLVGTALGHLAHVLFKPTAGDVSLGTSTGVWAAVMTTFLHGITEFDADARVMMGTILLASDLGLVGGAMLTKVLPMSRGRALLIDASGLLGTLTGLGVDLLIQGDDPDAAPLFTLGLVGMAAGLGLGVVLTREWDVEDAPAVQLGFLPVKDGGGVGLSGAW
ncbi:MAG: hypothetical protein HYV07_32385 [Deltaproteobacteria bacterium]|nr:hypothetical protein [Deltaproteobacteria bacterium]